MSTIDNTEKVKVIELINSIVDAGAETIVKDIIVNLDKKRFDVTLLTEKPNAMKNANVRELLNKRVVIKSLHPLAKDGFFNKVFRKLFYIFIPSKYLLRKREEFIQKTIKEIEPDVIHVHLQMLKYLVPMANELKNTKIIYSCYTLPSRYFNHMEMEKNYNDASFLSRNNGMIFTGMHSEMVDELNALFNVNNTMILRNGIDLSTLDCNLSKQEARKIAGLPENVFLIGHLGRLYYIKNQLFLIDVFEEILKRNNNSFLLLIGDGEDKCKILNKIKQKGMQDKCKLLSHVDDLSLLYRSMDVFVFPSLFEGIPNACIEAQVAGVRCVISSSITKDVFFSENAIEADLNEELSEWARKILDTSIKGSYKNDISLFEIKTVISKIESIYTS